MLRHFFRCCTSLEFSCTYAFYQRQSEEHERAHEKSVRQDPKNPERQTDRHRGTEYIGKRFYVCVCVSTKPSNIIKRPTDTVHKMLLYTFSLAHYVAHHTCVYVFASMSAPGHGHRCKLETRARAPDITRHHTRTAQPVLPVRELHTNRLQ